MQTLLVVDAQNEFSAQGLRPVPNHTEALNTIRWRMAQARQEGRPIVWVRHHNRPNESRAFVPGSWGAEFSPGLGPLPEREDEVEFVKDVFGAFTGTAVGAWLEAQRSNEVLIVGFFTHMCVSTTAREALMRGLRVAVDPDATGAFPVRHELLGEQSAEEVRRTALLHLSHLGVRILPRETGES